APVSLARPARSPQQCWPGAGGGRRSRGTPIPAPRGASASSRSPTPGIVASTCLPVSRPRTPETSRSLSPTRRIQGWYLNRASRGSVQDCSRTSPRTPKAPATLPSRMRRPSLMSGCPWRNGAGGSGRSLGRGFLDQRGDLVGQLGTVRNPVLHALGVDFHALLVALGDRVVIAQALEGATVALVARIGDDDVVEGALLGATAGQTDLDHVVCSVVLGLETRPGPGRGIADCKPLPGRKIPLAGACGRPGASLRGPGRRRQAVSAAGETAREAAAHHALHAPQQALHAAPG